MKKAPGTRADCIAAYLNVVIDFSFRGEEMKMLDAWVIEASGKRVRVRLY